VFGAWKRSEGLRRMRWHGVAKAALEEGPAATAGIRRRTATPVGAAASERRTLSAA
jgi:IS5 family transposase